ncbi:MAG: hypothetical protein Q4C84_08315 [Bacillota bacterium]|nr:hypothetical protein [Bacillota bacterium]
MANDCQYEMKIKGTKSNCKEWLKKMQSYDEKNHFWRIFEAEVYDEDGSEEDYYMVIAGDCAWSLESCCRASGYSDGIDLFEINTKELALEMEVYSSEPGLCFEEHYHYKNGNCLIAECVEAFYENIYLYNTFEEFKECLIERDAKFKTLKEDEAMEEYKFGGFSSWEFSI